MRPVWYIYEEEEYDLDNIYNEDEDRSRESTSNNAGSYGMKGQSFEETCIWYS